ncbi:MAG: T9SS type A sorting domain-containing protein, partial [Flavobacteriales bacterium]|nr:T9SS type A sorting domain-containing protein [Flavobacteriales bacterium]
VDGATISVVDVFGKQLEQYILTNTDKHILKRNNKASGVYFVEIEVEGVKLFSKIIIE